jgi:hypothetical protein
MVGRPCPMAQAIEPSWGLLDDHTASDQSTGPTG